MKDDILGVESAISPAEYTNQRTSGCKKGDIFRYMFVKFLLLFKIKASIKRKLLKTGPDVML